MVKSREVAGFVDAQQELYQNMASAGYASTISAKESDKPGLRCPAGLRVNPDLKFGAYSVAFLFNLNSTRLISPTNIDHLLIKSNNAIQALKSANTFYEQVHHHAPPDTI